jgi:hypothetical protein
MKYKLDYWSELILKSANSLGLWIAGITISLLKFGGPL